MFNALLGFARDLYSAKMVLADTVSTVGTVIAGMMMGAQLPAMYQVIFKTKSVEKLSVLPTIGQSLNFISWVLYALQNGDGNLLRVNVIGCGFMVLYLGIFLTYTRGSAWYKLVGMLTAGCVLGGAVESSIIYLEGNKDTRITLLGAVAVACNVVMYLAPIKSIATAYKDMDPEVIPALLTVVNTFLSTCWMFYGLLVGNWFVAGPNVAGSLLCITQLFVSIYVNVKVSRDPELKRKLKIKKAAAGSHTAEDGGDSGESDGAGLLGQDSLA